MIASPALYTKATKPRTGDATASAMSPAPIAPAQMSRGCGARPLMKSSARADSIPPLLQQRDHRCGQRQSSPDSREGAGDPDTSGRFSHRPDDVEHPDNQQQRTRNEHPRRPRHREPRGAVGCDAMLQQEPGQQVSLEQDEPASYRDDPCQFDHDRWGAENAKQHCDRKERKPKHDDRARHDSKSRVDDAHISSARRYDSAGYGVQHAVRRLTGALSLLPKDQAVT